MVFFSVNDHLIAAIVKLPDAFLHFPYDRAGSIDELNARRLCVFVGRGRLAVCTNQDFPSVEMFKIGMRNCLQSSFLKPIDLHRIMEDVAEHIELFAAAEGSQLLFGNIDSPDDAPAKP